MDDEEITEEMILEVDKLLAEQQELANFLDKIDKQGDIAQNILKNIENINETNEENFELSKNKLDEDLAKFAKDLEPMKKDINELSLKVNENK